MMKPKFDGYAAQYDAWFMENDNLFQSELRLFQTALGDIAGKRVLSVGCGSGLFESMIDCSGIEGIEPSHDMGAIAQKRGVNVIAFGAIEDAELEENAYDVIYLNGSSSYMEDLTRAFNVCKKALKPNGKFISLDVPKESAFGFMYLLAKEAGTFDHPSLSGRTRSSCAARACGTPPRRRSTRSRHSASTILTFIRRCCATPCTPTRSWRTSCPATRAAAMSPSLRTNERA